MKHWASIHLKLLINEHCSTVLNTTTQILNGLASFYAEMIGAPEWPSSTNKHTAIFLLKLYLSNNYLQIKDLEEFLEIPSKKILMLGTKLLIDTESNKEATTILSNLNLSDFDATNKLQKTFVSKTLLNFD